MDSTIPTNSLPDYLVTRTCQLTVYGYMLLLSTFWFRKLAPSFKWDLPSVAKPISNKAILSSMVNGGISHLFYSCIFFIGVKALTFLSQFIALETPNAKLSFFHQLSVRFLTPQLTFGDYLAIDAAIFLCKGTFSFIIALGACNGYYHEYAILSVFFMFTFISLFVTSLSVFNPDRIYGIIEGDAIKYLMPKLNVYFIWLIIPCIVVLNLLPIVGEFSDRIQMGLYGIFVFALVTLPSSDILGAIMASGGITALSKTHSLFFLLHAIMYGLMYAFGYKAIFAFNTYLNSQFDSEVAPFNPVADDFSGSLITLFRFCFLQL